MDSPASSASAHPTTGSKKLTKNQIRGLTQLKKAIKTANKTIASIVDFEDIAIFVGSTRAGKSTLINFLIGNTLIAEKESPFSPIWLKLTDDSDGPKIGFGATSETVLPSKWTSEKLEGIALWDAPGFDDNRGEVQDITNAFCIKELLTSVKSAKIVLVTDINDIAGSDNIKPFLALMKSVENILGDKLEKCLPAIAVIFTKVPKRLYDNDVNKEFVSDLLRHKFRNTSIAISPNVKKLINHIINNTNNFGFFNKVETCQLDQEDLDTGIEDAILHVGKIKRSTLKLISPSISQDSKILLFTVQHDLCSLAQFKVLLSKLKTVYIDNLIEIEKKIQKESDESRLKRISEKLSKMEKKIKKVEVEKDASLYNQLVSLKEVSSEVKDVISENKMLDKAKILVFIDDVLQLKHNDIFRAELSRIVSSIMLRVQKNYLKVEEKLGKLTRQQVKKLKEKLQEDYDEEDEVAEEIIYKFEKHNEEKEEETVNSSRGRDGSPPEFSLNRPGCVRINPGSSGLLTLPGLLSSLAGNQRIAGFNNFC